MRTFQITFLLLCFLPVFRKAEGQDLGKYQLILDKQILGSVKAAPPAAPRPEPDIAPPSWAREYQMTMITQDEERVRVGLQNIRDNSAILLIEGEESHPEFTLVSADADQGNARIRYRGVEHRFELQSGPVVSARADQREASVTTTVRGRTRRIIRPPGPRLPAGISDGTSDESPAPPQEAPVRRFETREELEAHLKEQQMDAIRSGKPPLPIPLTEEMDDQLVREGVLPPRGE